MSKHPCVHVEPPIYSNDYEEINRLEGHENEVKCCAFSPSGEYLATCSRDKSVWFWQCK